MIQNILIGLKDRLIYIVILALASGIIAGQFTGDQINTYLELAVVPALFVMIYPMMINLNIQKVLHVKRHLRPVTLTLLVNFVFAPIIAVSLAWLFFSGSPAYAVGLYLIALIPTSGMTAAWTGLAGGDLEAALVAMAVNLLAAVVILPPYLSVLAGNSVTFAPMALYEQLLAVVILPMIAGMITRRYLIRRYDNDGFKRLKPMFGGISTVGVMLIVFIAMAMRSSDILADPVTSVITVVPLVIFYALVFLAGLGVGRLLLSSEQSVTLIYATSMRNLSVALAIVIASDTIGAEAVLPIAIAYVLQPPLGAVYMHYRQDIANNNQTVTGLLRERILT